MQCDEAFLVLGSSEGQAVCLVSAVQPVHLCISNTSLNMSAGINPYPITLLLLSLQNAVSTSLAVIGESIDFGEPSNMSTPCSTPSWNWFSKCFATIDETLCLSAMTCLNSSCTGGLQCGGPCSSVVDLVAVWWTL